MTRQRDIARQPNSCAIIVAVWCPRIGSTNGPWSTARSRLGHSVSRTKARSLSPAYGTDGKTKETGEVLESFAIVTVEPNEWMAKYHDRMGVIIEPKNYQRWLEPGEVHSLPFDLLRPYPEEDLESWRVSDQVGDAKNNWAKLIEPIPEDTPKVEKKPKRKKPKKEEPPRLFE